MEVGVVHKKSVSVNMQMLSMLFLPTAIWAAYRIEKLRLYLTITIAGFGGGGYLFSLIFLTEEEFTSDLSDRYITMEIIFLLAAIAIMIPLIRKWTLEWNKKLSADR